MKISTALAVLIATSASAFTVVSPLTARNSALAAEYEPMEGETKINLKIDLESEKVRNGVV